MFSSHVARRAAFFMGGGVAVVASGAFLRPEATYPPVPQALAPRRLVVQCGAAPGETQTPPSPAPAPPSTPAPTPPQTNSPSPGKNGTQQPTKETRPALDPPRSKDGLFYQTMLKERVLFLTGGWSGVVCGCTIQCT